MPPIRKITPEILSRWLQVSHTTVLKWVRLGELPALNIGTGEVPRFVIYRKDAVAFLRKRGMTAQQLADLGLE